MDYFRTMPNKSLPRVVATQDGAPQDRAPQDPDVIPFRGTRGPPRERGGFAVVGVGASAGGLEACKKLLASVSSGSGLVFILVQHLDPKHESMMVDLLSDHTAMPVVQAGDGMLLAPDHVYIIPPGVYLSVKAGA
jgi:two-component system CheB/CheR fusion protein